MENTSLWDTLGGTKWIVIWGLLGTYGAVEAFFRLLKGVPKAFNWVRYHWRNRHLAKDFYYKRREYAYRIGADQRTYLHMRRETVVALQRITEIPVSFRWTGEGEVETSIEPGTFSLVDAARIKGQTRTRKLIRPDTALEKRGTAEYTFTVKCTVNGKQPESFLGSQSSHRIDELILRVIFGLSHMPNHVWFVVQNPDGQETLREVIDRCDPITGEYRKLVKRPDAHLIYILEWD